MKARDALIELRQELLDKLRPCDSATVEEIERINAALAIFGEDTARSTISREFMGMTVLEASQFYLRKLGRETSISELTRELLSRGVSLKKGSRSPEWKVAQSLSYHANKKLLTIADGMVGLPEWRSKTKGK